ncbi:MAG: DUF971 domain-containing protein [Sandaracinus sp.]|nr:DUF971 domain-containing protein [Sandaracinus sp.]MCB9636727.1 DUF971 domain-containing protein [Sandaracinus sp.]
MSELEPVEVRAPDGARLMEIDWSDGSTSLLTHRVLRAFCPCAVCQGHHGPITHVDVSELPDEAFAIVDLAESGQYALRMSWGDGHNTGIYRFSFLRALGTLYGEADVTDRSFDHDV